MPSNRTVASPSVTSGVRDVTDEATRALARAAYQARKQTIQGLEDRKADLKAELDVKNEARVQALNEARELQMQIDKLDEAIAAAKADG